MYMPHHHSHLHHDPWCCSIITVTSELYGHRAFIRHLSLAHSGFNQLVYVDRNGEILCILVYDIRFELPIGSSFPRFHLFRTDSLYPTTTTTLFRSNVLSCGYSYDDKFIGNWEGFDWLLLLDGFSYSPFAPAFIFPYVRVRMSVNSNNNSLQRLQLMVTPSPSSSSK